MWDSREGQGSEKALLHLSGVPWVGAFALGTGLGLSIVLSSLPKVVKRRVHALKNLQVKCAHIEAKFYEEVHELERKYAALYQPLFDKVPSHSHLTSAPSTITPTPDQ